MASWFLHFIIVHDLQTREKFYFICNNWLAVDKQDGLIDRIIPVAGEKQKLDVVYMAEKQIKQKLTDKHLWFSLVLRPPISSFTRIDRLTCCFLLLYLSMFANILYYGQESSTRTDDIVLGPFSINKTGVKLILIFTIFYLLLILTTIKIR
jgi:polycystin 1L2